MQVYSYSYINEHLLSRHLLLSYPHQEGSYTVFLHRLYLQQAPLPSVHHKTQPSHTVHPVVALLPELPLLPVQDKKP